MLRTRTSLLTRGGAWVLKWRMRMSFGMRWMEGVGIVSCRKGHDLAFVYGCALHGMRGNVLYVQ